MYILYILLICRIALAAVRGLVAVAFYLCGRHHQLDQEAEPEGVAVNSEATSSVEGGEGDEDPSTPPTGDDPHADDPPSYVRISTNYIILKYTSEMTQKKLKLSKRKEKHNLGNNKS